MNRRFQQDDNGPDSTTSAANLGEAIGATMPKLLLTVPEAAACLSVSRAHLYRLIQAGELRVVHSRGAVRVPYSELERYVERLLNEER